MQPKILVPLDGSALAERALEQAEKIGKALGYEVILFRVIQNPLADAPEAGPAAEESAAMDTIGTAGAYLQQLASRLEAKGIKTRIEDGRTGLTRALMGSVAEKVVYTTKRPVMLVKPEKVLQARTDEAVAILKMHQ
jgi:nucleotide-binding universal stress UspA family protein